uniref:Uncharacterized protein n=1 Tax=Anguilla anguilla TaxID=7936 RepID=A0A0E9V087_ANGAN
MIWQNHVPGFRNHTADVLKWCVEFSAEYNSCLRLPH